MSQVLVPQQEEHKSWKTAFIALSAVILIIMLLLSHSYGQSGDEWLQIIYGHDIWNYFVHGNQQALDYSAGSLQFQKQELYGGFFDFLMDVLHEWFPSVRIFILRHFFNALSGAAMMVYTGLIAYRVSKKWSVAVIALLFIFFSPRIFGESMNNPKDIPFACGFVVAMYYFLALLQDFPLRKWKNVVGLAIGFAMAFGVRAAGGILELVYFGLFFGLFYFLQPEARGVLQADKSKLLKQLIGCLVIGVAAGYIVGLLCWPWGLESPISHPLESLKGMTHRETVIPVLYEGVYRENYSMPWYYELKWLVISNPLIVIAGLALFLFLMLRARKQYGLFLLIVVVFCAFFPLLYMIYKKSSVYDTWRHVFFVYPFWVILSALGVDLAGTLIKNARLMWLPRAVAAAGLLPIIIWMIQSHPNEYVYFNELAGGVKGAVGEYDLDYYQNTSLQAAEWIEQHAPKPAPGQKVTVLSNMNGFDNYFARDSAWIASAYARYADRNARDWDYYIANPRYLPVEVLQDNKWVPQNVVHTISVSGVPLAVIIQRKSRAGIAASTAFQKKDYATAVQQYTEYIKADTTDDNVYFCYGIALASTGQVDAGIASVKRAIAINPGQPQYFDILSKLYQAKGDQQNARDAGMKAQALSAKQQEDKGEQPEEQ